MKRRREHALEQFMSDGFPSRKHEEWRYTPLSRLAEGPCSPLLEPSEGIPESSDLPIEMMAKVVLLNGEFRQDLSDLSALPPAVRIQSLNQMRRTDPDQLASLLDQFLPQTSHPFHHLSDALLDDGVHIEVVEEGAKIESPIHILHIIDGQAHSGSAHVTGLIQVATGAHLDVIEEIRSTGEVLGNLRWGIGLDPQATLKRVRAFRPECASIFHGTRVVQQQGSRFDDLFSSSGGELIRNELHVIHEGTGCHCELLGAYVGRGKEHLDHHTTIDHKVEDCTSREVYRGVLSDRARGVFSGMIHVHQDAQRTDAKQSNDTILLSDTAEANTRPRLEIYADDVKCTHGATIGELDENAIFYLRSRGVSVDEARKIMVRAFTSEVFVQMEDRQLSDFIVNEIQESIQAVEVDHG
ncbi:MAG: Fe-S cluster assembly protein SufD [Planctomycetota bacterium]|nr:Fe-S cluster assembly protein SufD [Planctomycetota bacterium]